MTLDNNKELCYYIKSFGWTKWRNLMEDVVFLSLNNRQINTRSIFIGIQRARLPSREQIDRSLLSGEALAIPVRFIGQWELFVGVVQYLTIFPDGMLITINPQYKGSVLQNWPGVLLWIPSSQQEMAGVLNYSSY